MSTLTCEQTLTLITAARDLPPRDCSAVTEHLTGCDECRMGALSCAEAVSLMERAMARGSASPDAVALASHLVRCDRCRPRRMRALTAGSETCISSAISGAVRSTQSLRMTGIR